MGLARIFPDLPSKGFTKFLQNILKPKSNTSGEINRYFTGLRIIGPGGLKKNPKDRLQ